MLEEHIRGFLQRRGRFFARYPMSVLAVAAVFTFIIGFVGIRHARVEASPQKLWEAPHSQTAKNHRKFNDAFTPYFRAEELIAVPRKRGNAVTYEYLSELMDIQSTLTTMKDPETGLNIDSFCWRPIDGKGCFTQSPLAFFQSNRSVFEDRESSFSGGAAAWVRHCVESPVQDKCYDDLGLPVEHTTVFGDESYTSGTDDFEAGAFVLTLLLQNTNEPAYRGNVESWEKNVFLATAAQWSANQSASLDIYYMADRSPEDAVKLQNKGSMQDVVISYAVMFAYIGLALGYFHKLYTKVMVALSGIIFVGMSLAVSIGFCSLVDVPLTLIIIDVIPFLLLAIGVDNMFIINNQVWLECQRRREAKNGQRLTHDDVIDAIGDALAEVGGTIFLAGSSEGVAFSLGALTPMPAVQAFCLYSGVAILCNLMFQLTAYIAILSLDTLRAEANRVEVLPCVQLDDGSIPGIDDVEQGPPAPSTLQKSFTDDKGLGAPASPLVNTSYIENRERTREAEHVGLGTLVRYGMLKHYVPKVILNPVVRIIVVASFIAFAFIAVFVLIAPSAQLGLQRTSAIPNHFYLRDMFKAMNQFLQVGPLAYFVSPNELYGPLTNFSNPESYAAFGLLRETLRDDAAYVDSASVASWFHDFRRYLCFNDQLMSVTVGQGCVNLTEHDVRASDFNCGATQEATANAIPFKKFAGLVKSFINSPGCCRTTAGLNTGICGFQYGEEVELGQAVIDADGRHIRRATADEAQTTESFEYVVAHRVRTQTTPLRGNVDFVASMLSAYNTTDSLNALPAMQDANLSLYPYSIYYLYYAQYMTLTEDAIKNVAIALAAVAVVTFVVLSSATSTLAIVLCILMIIVDVAAICIHWDVNINAISVTNVVMAIGISVEFCAHIAVSFCTCRGTVEDRICSTMVDMGSNVVCGITLTKLLGVTVLNFSPSEVFRVYYFRMYIAIIIFGALHGLLFLPCLLVMLKTPSRSRRQHSVSR